jgi:hypothetical protein
MKFSNAIGKLHCGAGFNTGQKQKTLSVPGRLWSMYIRAVEWNLTTGLLTVSLHCKKAAGNPYLCVTPRCGFLFQKSNIACKKAAGNPYLCVGAAD